MLEEMNIYLDQIDVLGDRNYDIISSMHNMIPNTNSRWWYWLFDKVEGDLPEIKNSDWSKLSVISQMGSN